MVFQIEYWDFAERSHFGVFEPARLQFAWLPLPRLLGFVVLHSFSTFSPFDVDSETKPMMRWSDLLSGKPGHYED